MITHEKHGADEVVTILDDRGNDADIEVHFKDGGPNVLIRQLDPDSMSCDVIVLSPSQAGALMVLLNEIIGEEKDTLN
jgi:hypothetical protein